MRRPGPIFALLVLVSFVLLVGAVAFLLLRSPDPRYLLEEWIGLGRTSRYDLVIGDVARRHGLDPLLVKAVVWRESRFHPDKKGSRGERGLMQIGEAAAVDWVRQHKIETFVPTDLFSPRTNLEVGVWYLERALGHWREKDDPVPFALAEYNAGKRRVEAWIAAASGTGEAANAEAFRARIDFPSTRAYVETVLQRYAYYREVEGRRPGLAAPPQP